MTKSAISFIFFIYSPVGPLFLFCFFPFPVRLNRSWLSITICPCTPKHQTLCLLKRNENDRQIQKKENKRQIQMGSGHVYSSSSQVQSSYLEKRRGSVGDSTIPETQEHLLSVWQVSSHDQRNLLLVQFFDSNLQGIRFSFKINKHRSVHAEQIPISQPPIL